MRTLILKLFCASVIVFIILMSLIVAYDRARVSGNAAQAVDWAALEKAMGVRGDVHADGTATFSIPRGLPVTLDGVALAPGSDMSSDFTFMRAGDKAMMVGEIMLKEDEVANVTKMLADSGIRETALHNHLLRETPHIMWLHVHGYGDAVALARAIHDITASTGGIFGPGDGHPLRPSGLDTATLDRIIGAKGTSGDGVYAYSIPRRDSIRMDGVVLPQEMDISTEISFQPLGHGTAALIGELVLEADEVEPVIKSLSDHGIEVTAVHSHMITEEPRLFYLHCWAKGDAPEMAQAMHEALKQTNSAII